ncbi:MAG: DNA repair protein RadA [Planctomycetota bacterium]|nr:DNA repair protein RadA [Planctomycetota bacterium]
MSKRQGVTFFCKQCGHETTRWEGKCPACHEWDTLVEAPVEKAKPAGRRGRDGSASRLTLTAASTLKPLREHARDRLPRIPVPLAEFHRVLGGGIVPGGSVLVGGEPGIGKSTLLLQLLAALAAADPGGEAQSGRKPCWVYITGEEAPSQIAARGLRLSEPRASASGPVPHGRGAAHGFDSEQLKLASETDLSNILNMLEAERPQVAVVDSIQTVHDGGIESAAGSVSQVRECAMALVDAGRQLNTAVFLIGHVTKDGVIAGPRVLEHIVDTVLSFEGEMRLDLRVLRASKNRFGSTDEAGFFEMTQAGLIEVPDPSAALLDRDSAADKGPGSAIGALCEGTRVLLVELQGLTVAVPGGGSPRRRASGVDAGRLAQLLAVLEARAAVPFGTLDVFASAAGGFRVDEPAADLPLALALASIATGRPVREGLVAAGEVGLGGEIRPVPRREARVAAARRLGCKTILLPARGRTHLPSQIEGAKILRARTLREALAMGLA